MGTENTENVELFSKEELAKKEQERQTLLAAAEEKRKEYAEFVRSSAIGIYTMLPSIAEFAQFNVTVDKPVEHEEKLPELDKKPVAKDTEDEFATVKSPFSLGTASRGTALFAVAPKAPQEKTLEKADPSAVATAVTAIAATAMLAVEATVKANILMQILNFLLEAIKGMPQIPVMGFEFKQTVHSPSM
ncbi:MAG TPA: hypothetical protein VGV92_03740 [Gammaproteobacteria bacterium]|nr:hypothetical protein [Gammaproteobacteria bacterium]